MSGSGTINHPLRDEPGLKTKKVNHHSSEYSSPATHVRQGSWGNVCVTRCMCKYSREHSCVYVVGIIQYWERVLISVLLSSDPKKFPRKISSCLQEILGFKNFLGWEKSSQNFLRKFWARKFCRKISSETRSARSCAPFILSEASLKFVEFWQPKNGKTSVRSLCVVLNICTKLY